MPVSMEISSRIVSPARIMTVFGSSGLLLIALVFDINNIGSEFENEGIAGIRVRYRFSNYRFSWN
jgi:hypothetical protein